MDDKQIETQEGSSIQTVDLVKTKKEQLSFRDKKIALHASQIAHNLWPELLSRTDKTGNEQYLTIAQRGIFKKSLVTGSIQEGQKTNTGPVYSGLTSEIMVLVHTHPTTPETAHLGTSPLSQTDLEAVHNQQVGIVVALDRNGVHVATRNAIYRDYTDFPKDIEGDSLRKVMTLPYAEQTAVRYMHEVAEKLEPLGIAYYHATFDELKAVPEKDTIVLTNVLNMTPEQKEARIGPGKESALAAD